MGLFYFMLNNTYYFQHDYNAANDEKILYLRSIYGMEGYGLYWYLIELMHQSQNSKLKCKLINGIAYQLNIDINMLLSFYNNCIDIQLFVTDDEYYWSERVLINKELQDEKRKLKSLAGKKGMLNRWGNNNEITNDNIVITEDNKRKESKINESKVKEKKVKESKVNILDSEFEEWWIAYDYKKSKEKAITSWNTLTQQEKNIALSCVLEYVKSTPDKNYRKHPTTYLNQKCFNDEITYRNNATNVKPNSAERRFEALKSLHYIDPNGN